MAPNLSVFAIPVYWLLSLYPHTVAITTIKASNNNRWNNSNPSGTQWREELKKVPAEVLAKYERAEAAHKNGMENMSLFIGTVVLGNLAKLDSSTLNTFAGIFLALRVVYTILYINTTQNKKSYYRSLIWVISSLSAVTVLIKAAIKLS